MIPLLFYYSKIKFSVKLSSILKLELNLKVVLKLRVYFYFNSFSLHFSSLFLFISSSTQSLTVVIGRTPSRESSFMSK